MKVLPGFDYRCNGAHPMILSKSPSRPQNSLPDSNPSPQILQLWVEHNLNVSARSAILIAQLNAHHAAARTDQLAQSVNTSFPSNSKRHSVLHASSRISVSRDPGKRQALRNLRKQKLQSILLLEKQKRIEQKRADEQAAQRAAEKAAQNAAELAAREAALQQRTQTLSAQQASEAKPDTSKGPQSEPKESVKKPASARRVSFGATLVVGEPQQSKPTAPDQLPPEKQHQKSRQLSSPFDGNLLPAAEHALEVWRQVSEEADVFRQNFAAKKIRLSLKKRINLGVNQIAASIKQVSTKSQDLSRLIYETKSVAGSSGEAFAMKEIAQRLVKEADGSVALNNTAAYAVAGVIVGVTASVPDVARMRDVFLGAFYKHSMFTIPTYVRRRKEESIEEYRTRIGYKEEETADSFLERMCGCVSLFAAVLQTEKVYGGSHFGGQMQNPFSLDLGWSWLARIVNMDQKSLTPAVVHSFLETAGYGMARRYRKQFAKLVAMVQRAVVMNAVAGAPKGPVTRLDLFITEFISAGCTIPKAPEGRNLPARDAENL